MNIKKAKIKFGLIKQNREAKTLFTNFAWLSALQFASYLFPLITMPYLARVIGVDGFGKIAFASAIMVWVQTIADWGFNLTATRDVAQNRDNPQKVSEIFSNVLWARCLLMFLSLIILLVLIFLIPKFREESHFILISFLMIPGHILFPDWFFQAIERMKYITILNLLIKTLFTIAIFVFIKEKEDYILQPLFTSCGFVIAGLIALYFIIIKWKIKVRKPKLKTTIQTIKNSTDVFINNLMPNLYNSFSTMLLGLIHGSVAVGLLDGGNKFIQFGNQLLHTIDRTFFPFLSRKINKHALFMRINLTIAFIFALVLFIVAPFIVKYFLSDAFSESINVIRIRAISLIFLALSSGYGKNYLIIKHRDKLLCKITMWSSIVGFLLAIPLVLYFSFIGASLTVTICLGLIGIFSFIYAQKEMSEI